MEPGPGDDAVSPVIGVILMVAIAVLLAGIVFLLVASTADDQVDKRPSVAFQQDGRGEGGALEVITAPGAELDWSEVSIGDASDAICVLPTGVVTAGDKVLCLTEGRLVLIYQSATGAEVLLYDAQIR